MEALNDLIKLDFSTLSGVLRDILAKLNQQNERVRVLELANQYVPTVCRLSNHVLRTRAYQVRCLPLPPLLLIRLNAVPSG